MKTAHRMGAPAAIVALVVLGLWTAPVPTDEAFVSYQYARTLAGGHGLAFNPGDAPTEGYGSLPWVLLCAALDASGLDVPGAAPYASLFFGAVCVALLFVLLRRRASATGEWLAPLLLFASSAPLVMAAMTGTDATLFAALLLCCAWSLERVADRASPGRLALSCAAAVLTVACRFEGVVVAAAVAWVLLRTPASPPRARRAVVAAVAAIAIATLVYHVWRLATFGAFVPDYVRLHLGFNAGLFRRLAPFDTVPFGPLYLAVAVVTAAAFRLGKRPPGERFAVAVAAVLGLSYVFVVDPTPGLAGYAALLGLAVVPWPHAVRALTATADASAVARGRAGRALVAVSILVVGLGLTADNRLTIARMQEAHTKTLRPLGEWLANWRPGVSVAIERPGALSYYAGGPTLDLRANSRLGDPDRDRARALRHRAPDVVLLTAQGQTKNVYDVSVARFQLLLRGYRLMACLRMAWSHDRSVVLRLRGDIPIPPADGENFPRGIGLPFFGFEAKPE